MPIFPTLQEQSTYKLNTDVFYGYNHNAKIQDGEFYDEENLSAKDYPLLATRKPREIVKDLTKGQGVISKEYLAYVDNGTLYYNDQATGITGLSSGEKQMVSMGAYIVIFPDKKYFNTADSTDYGDIDASYESSGTVTISLCTLTGAGITPDYIQSTEPASPTNGQYWIDISGNTPALKLYNESTETWASVATCYTKIQFGNGTLPFSIYDGVNISGVTYSGSDAFTAEQAEALNGSHIIYGMGGDEENPAYIIVIGLLDYSFTQTAEITISRSSPDMDYVVEAQNRLWGCRYGSGINEIYASALGDFRNWNQFIGLSTDSYVASVGSDGKWTGAINYLGYPSFFKENSLHRVTVSSVGAHQISETQLRGVQDGSWKSLTVVNEILYYKGVNDIMAYQGGFPESIGRQLGDEKYTNAIGEVVKNVYYLSMLNSDNERVLFTYDADKGIWHKEEDPDVIDFCKYGDSIYALTENALINMSSDDIGEMVSWYAETGIIGWEYPENKYLSRFNIRFYMERGSHFDMYVEYDSSGEFILAGHIDIAKTGSMTIPLRPRRCDHLRLRLKGKGACKIYSIAKVLEIGSDY